MMHAVLGSEHGDVAEADEADAVLVRRAIEDPVVFGELYQRYRMRVYWYVRARTPTDDDAADVAQKVFLNAFSRLTQFRSGKASFATWLFTIARNASTDFGRRYEPTVAWDDLPDALHPLASGDPIEDLMRAENISRLRKLVATLDSDKRELLSLRYGADLTVREIAAVLGKGNHATYKKLSRLLKYLEEAYDESPNAS